MRRSWRTFASMLVLGVAPLAGCVQVPADKSVHDLRPIQPGAAAAPKQELSAADISKSLLQQADLLDKTGKTSDAVAAYQKMRSTNGPDAELATRRLAILYFRTGDMDRAEQEFHLLKLQNPKDAVTLTYLGNINYQRAMWGTAEKNYLDAIFYQPKHAEAWTGLGLTLAQKEAYSEAIEAFTNVVSKAEAYCCVARVMTQKGKRQDAVTAYQTALKLDPTLMQARTELARLQQTAMTETPTNVTLTTHLKAERRGSAELEDAPAQSSDGSSRLLMQRPTLPPLPESPADGAWPTPGQRK
jgi:tetratricopeptide (TPR) repeat protein